MTLILTKVSSLYTLQVTDRLVTTDCRLFDERANKAILYGARNGVVAMGYTGHAYLGDIPTDQWIVEQLTGMPFDRTEPIPAQIYRPSGPWPDIGESLASLAEAINCAHAAAVSGNLRQDWVNKLFLVCVSGYQWSHNGRFRPLWAYIEKPPGVSRCYVHQKDRHWHLGDRFTVAAAPPGVLTVSELEAITQDVKDKSPDEAENLFVQTINEASTRLPTVGRDCTSILLMPPSLAEPWARFRYVPAKQTTQSFLVPILDGQSSEQEEQNEPVLIPSQVELPVAFSPWLVTPRLTISPCTLTGGGWDALLGTYKVHIEAPDNPDDIVYMELSGQPRKPPP